MKLLPFILLVLSSCTTAKQVARWNATHKQEELQNCIDKYPPVVITDSAAYKESLAIIDALTEQINATAGAYESEKSELIETIERLSNIAPEDCDSLAEAIYRLSARERRRGDSAISVIGRIRNSPVKPVIVKEWDTKQVQLLTMQLQNCQTFAAERETKIDKLQKEVDKNKGKLVIRIPWWWLLIAGAALIGFIYWRIKAGALRSLLSKIKTPA